jgi:1,4-alpha-glucan branching enzyme
VGVFSKLFKGQASNSIQPASFLNPHSSLGELDLYLIAEGRHEQLWKALGAQVKRDDREHCWALLFLFGLLTLKRFP